MIALAPVPVTLIAPDWVKFPVEVAVKLVLAVTAPRFNGPLFRITTRVPVAATEPVKEFPKLLRITAPLGVPVEVWAKKVEFPPTVKLVPVAF